MSDYPIVKMSFRADIAKDAGTDSAIIFENIVYWIEKNRANEKHFYDGAWWTYNTVKAFESLFYWLTTDQIRRCLEKLVEKNYLITGNYNKNQYDRTKWYSVKSQMHLAEIPNGFGENPEPIPNSKPNNKQYIKESPIINELNPSPLGISKTDQTFKKDRKIKQPFRGFQQSTPKPVSTTGFSARPQGTLEDSLHDNLATKEDIEALARELKILPEQVEFTKKSYLLWVEEKQVLGANMRSTVARWLLKSLTEGKIEVHKNAAQLHNEQMMRLVESIEDGSFEI